MKSIIIGSGIAGIATAIRLKAKGHDVNVFEANSYPGGKLSEFKNDGFRFDAGPSLFTMPQFVNELFELMGENPKDFFEYERLDTSCHYFFEDGSKFFAPSDINAFAKMINTHFGEDSQSVLRFFEKSKQLYEITNPVFLENSLHQLKTYASKSGIKGILNLWRLNMFTTMNAKNKQYFKNPKVVQLFNRFATYNGSSPYIAPATLNIIPYLEFGFGTFFPKKGMVDITNALVNLAKRKGVQFSLNSKVDEIIVENKKAIGIKSNGEIYLADAVISNADVYPSYKNLLHNETMPSRVKHVNSSSSALIFYWGIKKSFEQLHLHNVFFSNDYKKEFDTIFKENAIDDDPTVYINITSKRKADDAPEGCENWFVMVNVPANYGQNWAQLVEKARQNILNKLSRILKTEIEPLIVNEEILDPIKIEQKTSSFRGALYGSSSNDMMAAFFRHANFSSNIKNLYFCGGSVHPGGGIPLCLLGAKITSELVKDSTQ